MYILPFLSTKDFVFCECAYLWINIETSILFDTFNIDIGVSDERKKKERDMIQSYDKSPYTNRKFKTPSDNKKRYQNAEYTTIATRLRTAR